MKKLLLAVLIIFCICLTTACEQNNETNIDVNDPNDVNTSTDTLPAQEADDPHDVNTSTDTLSAQTDKIEYVGRNVIEFTTVAEGSITDSETDECLDYKYRICHVNESVAGSEVINKTIIDQIESIINQQIADINEGRFPEHSDVDCEVYEYNRIYTIVFSITRWINNQNEYEVYYFDSVSGECISSPQVLEKVGISYFEEYLPAAVAVGKDRIGSPEKYPEEFRDLVEDALQRMELYGGLYPVYPIIKSDGKIEAIIPVASMAGPDYIYTQLPLELSAK